MTSGGREVDVEGALRTSGVLAIGERSMKSSTLFERGPLPPTFTSHPPDVIHVKGVPRPSPFFALFRFPVFNILEGKPKNKGGTRERG